MRVIVLLLLVLGFAGAITLEQALEIAKERANQIRLSELDIKKAEEEIKRARAGILPQVSISYNYTYLGQDLALGTIPNNRHSAVLQLNQTIFNKQVFELIKLANIQRELQNLIKEDMQRTLESQVKDLFYGLLYRKAIIKLQEENLDYWEENYKRVSAKFSAGVVPKVELLRAQSQLEQARSQLEQARADYLRALENFKALLKLEGDVEPEGALEMKEFSLKEEELLQALKEKNSTLRVAKKLVESARGTVELKRAQNFPIVNGFANYQLFTGKRSPVGDTDWLKGYSFGVSINYLIFDGFSRKAEISEAELDLLKQRENLLQLEYDLKARLRSTLLSINSLKAQIRAVQSSLEFAKESLRLSTERYRLGVGSQLEVLEARANYNNLLANYYLLLYQYNSSLASLERLIQ
ncbi:TolC family protein [Thermocrinis ruber]|uniref:TolC family protein n=1 Tax=Thermocrinis ruber TaxID=75906 RepID=UPI00046D0EED|nr:TolC family protein [Thermocrinis ruber]